MRVSLKTALDFKAAATRRPELDFSFNVINRQKIFLYVRKIFATPCPIPDKGNLF